MSVENIDQNSGEDRRSFQNLFLLNLLKELEKRECDYGGE